MPSDRTRRTLMAPPSTFPAISKRVLSPQALHIADDLTPLMRAYNNPCTLLTDVVMLTARLQVAMGEAALSLLERRINESPRNTGQ